MMNFEEQVKAIMEESAVDIQAQVKEQIKKQIIDSLTWSLRDEVSKIVRDTIVEDMKDDIKMVVLEAKPAIMDELRNTVAKMSAQIGNAMLENVSKNLSQSWNVNKLMETLFK